MVEVIYYVIPSLLVGTIAYLLVYKFLKSEEKKTLAEIKKANQQYVTPIRLQAYERVVLLLERIEPVKIVNRVIKPGMTARQMQNRLVTEIVNEFDHNITQQLYVTNKAWEAVLQAKEDAIKLVSVTATKMHPDDQAINYSRKLIEVQGELEMSISASAIQIVKAEARYIF